MKKRGSDYFKKRLANRLVYFPLLRLLIFNFWFRLVFAGFVLLLIFLAMFLPRIWRVTPPGFLPLIRISGLDMARAWSLKRSALRSMAAGDSDRAVYAWQAAVRNNPADSAMLRGALTNFLRLDRPNPGYQGLAVGQTLWLLRLSRTNDADVELVSQVYDKLRLYDPALRLLGPLEDRLSPSEESVYLKALFHSGQMARFAGRWQKSAGKRSNIAPDLRVYHAAYRAGWGPSFEAAAGRKQLEAALEDPDQRILSNRLRLLVCAHLGDADGYRESLQRLGQWQSDMLIEHVIYWQLLATLGRKSEAAELARQFAAFAKKKNRVVAFVPTSAKFARSVVPADFSAVKCGAGEPALAAGTRWPSTCWNTMHRSASVVSTAACATDSSTRSMRPDDASVSPTASSRSRSRAHRRLARARAIFARSSSLTNGFVR